jgi:hypothetical protein
MSKLFPGKSQELRFSDLLKSVLVVNQVVIKRDFGYDITQLGKHSIWKGASSYLVSLPGGPAAAATSIRGGWSICGVKDWYWQYMESGDRFVGQCLTLLPILHVNFAISPLFFNTAMDEECTRWVHHLMLAQFPVLGTITCLGTLCRMCLASLLYHCEWIIGFVPCNLVIITDSA